MPCMTLSLNTFDTYLDRIIELQSMIAGELRNHLKSNHLDLFLNTQRRRAVMEKEKGMACITVSEIVFDEGEIW